MDDVDDENEPLIPSELEENVSGASILRKSYLTEVMLIRVV